MHDFYSRTDLVLAGLGRSRGILPVPADLIRARTVSRDSTDHIDQDLLTETVWPSVRGNMLIPASIFAPCLGSIPCPPFGVPLPGNHIGQNAFLSSASPARLPRMSRRVIGFCTSLIIVCGLTAALWWNFASLESGEAVVAELPIPPFPPRIAEGNDYEACLTTLVADRAGLAVIAEAAQTVGSGDGAVHCRGLGLIAVGRPAQGAELLEELARQSSAPALARASVLGRAAQARLMVAQADQAADDASTALKLSPADTELFILRATAEGMLGHFQDAVDDLSQALQLDAARPDALVARAVMRRKLDQLDLAQADAAQALSLDPDDADALLERGILRQRLGDRAGARSDWEHARGVDPNGTTADLAAQNLSLLEAGPPR